MAPVNLQAPACRAAVLGGAAAASSRQTWMQQVRWIRGPDVSPAELDKVLAGPARLVDVRGRHELTEFNQFEGALVVPLDELPSKISELPKDQKLVFACRSGIRSAAAADYVADLGFETANLEGGSLGYHGVDFND